MRLVRAAVIGAICMGGVLGAQTAAPANGAPPQAVRRVARISSGVMQGLLIAKVTPVYPAGAKENGIQGTVVLHAIIGKDGHVVKVDAISGPDELKDAALDAVRQWTYRPYLLNGEPTEVDTTIIVNFNLSPPHN
jgi:protein TonB